jgi:hypothetical protein
MVADVLGCDGHFDVSIFFELHFIAILIRQRIFNSEIAMPMVGAVNSNLGSFRSAQTRRNDLLTVPGTMPLSRSGIRRREQAPVFGQAPALVGVFRSPV